MKNKIKSKKRLYLFIPLMAVLVLMNVAAFAVAVIGKNVWLFIACFFLLVLTLVGIYMIASLSKSINKFYQTMEKQLSPYTNKSLRDFPLPVLVTRRRGGEIIWYNNQMREKVFGGSDCFGHSLAEYFPAVNLQTECPVQGYGVEYNGHQYTAYQPPECTVSGGRRQAQTHRTGVLFLPTGGSHHPHRQLRGAAAKRA